MVEKRKELETHTNTSKYDVQWYAMESLYNVKPSISFKIMKYRVNTVLKIALFSHLV